MRNGEAQADCQPQSRRDENNLSAVLEFYEEVSGRPKSEVAWPNGRRQESGLGPSL